MDYTYRVEWSPADGEFVGLVAEFPSLSWLAPTEDEAMRGIVGLVEQIAAADHHDTERDGNPLLDVLSREVRPLLGDRRPFTKIEREEALGYDPNTGV
ncbi:hypothetical protein [Mycobacterium deserti]|uniref:Antitoxin HicB n=1 Tax=Mycobacterium deserti TaxID=2978347 RepID=A0ABT2M720_9MYCO|nr:hypothetical protein [Mycobacterium deserti]MCT7658055.1 hypothetical protein [Mycobacterium deserti]